MFWANYIVLDFKQASTYRTRNGSADVPNHVENLMKLTKNPVNIVVLPHYVTGRTG